MIPVAAGRGDEGARPRAQDLGAQADPILGKPIKPVALVAGVTGVCGDASNLDDHDRLLDTVKRERGKIDVLYASAGPGEAVPLGEITEEHFDAAFDLNTRGRLFTVQKALPLFIDGGSIFMTGSIASIKGFLGFSGYAASKATLLAFVRGWLNELKGRKIRVNVLSPGRLPPRIPGPAGKDGYLST